MQSLSSEPGTFISFLKDLSTALGTTEVTKVEQNLTVNMAE